MRRLRPNPIVIGIIFAVLCIGAPIAMYILMIQPTNEAIAQQQQRYEPVKQYTDPVQGPQLLSQANKSLASAQKQAAATRAQWDYVLRTKNPPLDPSDKWRAWFEWTGELEFDFAPRINNFLRHSGIQPLTTISAPAPPNNPAGVPQGIVAMPLGSISVFGSYNDILNHVVSWNRFDRIVLVDGLSLSGYSPFMTGTYSATEYIFPRPGSPSAAGGAAAAATAAPAAPTGAPGMPPGYPGAPGAPGAAGGGSGEALPKPTHATNFEDAPEYHIHLKEVPAPAAGGANAAPGGFGGAPGAFGAYGGRPPGVPPMMGGRPMGK